jgi:flagellar basal body-associated protein FliL
MSALLAEHVWVSLIVTAYVFTHVGMALGLWLNRHAIEEAKADVDARVVGAYMQGVRNARLQAMAERTQSRKAVERAAMAERN